jgi:hypothetical protein
VREHKDHNAVTLETKLGPIKVTFTSADHCYVEGGAYSVRDQARAAFVVNGVPAHFSWHLYRQDGTPQETSWDENPQGLFYARRSDGGGDHLSFAADKKVKGIVRPIVTEFAKENPGILARAGYVDQWNKVVELEGDRAKAAEALVVADQKLDEALLLLARAEAENGKQNGGS